MSGDQETTINTIELVTELTIAWLNNPNNRANADDVAAFLERMHSTLDGFSQASPSAEAEKEFGAQKLVPAVSVRKSLSSPDHIISMIDGKPYKMLKSHLNRHGLTPQQYRDRYNLKPDYPMVAASYSESRRAFARKMGLGFKSSRADVDELTKPSRKQLGVAGPPRGRE
jgi:predicted transcriptional regulator